MDRNHDTGEVKMEFKGFDDWVEIFRGGAQVDSRGKEHDGDRLIERAVATFNPAVHEPPAVIGHPDETAPSYAWVEGLKTVAKDGRDVLMAKFKQVVPEFEDMVKRGLFKKRSASFLPRRQAAACGFLGAMPPAVKGLSDVAFGDGGAAITFDFGDEGLNVVARLFRRLRDWLIEKDGLENADKVLPDWDVEYMGEIANRRETETAEPVPAFSGAATEDGMQSFKEKIKGILTTMGVDMSKVPDDALPDAPAGEARPRRARSSPRRMWMLPARRSVRR